ncbi:MAG: S41 family peptidase [Bdellovibrionales bacterium]
MIRPIFSLLLTTSVFTSSILFSNQALAQEASGQIQLQCQFVYTIEQMFLGNHIKFQSRGKDMEVRLIDQYIKRLDGSKIYFTKADIEKVKKQMSGAFDKIKNRKCDFLKDVHSLYLSKVQARSEFAKNLLNAKYKLDETAEFTFDPDKRDYYKTDKEAEEFVRNYIHFQVANYLSTDMKLEEAKKSVLKNYDRAVKRVEETTPEDLLVQYLDSFARALDPHSSFLSRDFFEEFNINMSLSLEGIGATLSQQDGFTIIDALVPGGAAARSGMVQTQDKILAVGQEKGPMENVIDLDLKDVVKKIRGKKGTKVKLNILRAEGEGKTKHEVTLVRDKVSLEDEAAQLVPFERDINGKKRKFGVINLPSFYSDGKRGGRSCAADVKKLVKQAQDQKLEGLVLDFSQNGGGSLEDAVKIAGLFFKTGSVVKQAGRSDGREEQVYADTDAQIDWAGPLVILTSRVSASASEIVAGALQDYKRAVVVGADHTFGKGSIQTVVPIPYDLGAVKVTIGMFYIPGGNSTQHRGVDGDVTLPNVYLDDLGEKTLDYSLPPVKLPAFLSPEAMPKAGEKSWVAVTPDVIKKLKESSEKRVASDSEFKKQISEAKKSQEKSRLIKVADILKDSKEKNEKEKKQKLTRYNKEERLKEYVKRPEIVEAVAVLADLSELTKAK